MQRGSLLWCVAVVVGLASAGGTAEAGGPHFMAEGNLGLVGGLGQPETTDNGFVAGALLGVGGRFANTLPRFYFMLEYLTAGYARTHEQNLRPLELDRRLHEVGLVGRVVIPLFPALRLFGDLGVMAVHSDTAFVGEHLATEDSAELDLGFRFATGLQVRPSERFSVGLRLSMTTTLDGFDTDTVPGWLVGFDSEYGHREASLQLTVYF